MEGVLVTGAQQYYQALALAKLGQQGKADAVFRSFVDDAAAALAAPPAEEQRLRRRASSSARLAAAHYVAGLGHLGLNETSQANSEFAKTLELCPDHLGASTVLKQ